MEKINWCLTVGILVFHGKYLIIREYIFGKNSIIRYLIRKHSLPIYLFDYPISFQPISVDEVYFLCDTCNH